MKKLHWFFVVLLSVSMLVFSLTAVEASKNRFAVVGVLHPYFAPWEGATQDFMNKTGIECIYRATVHFSQPEENDIVEGLVTLGYNGFALWPGHPSAVNVTITELVKKGIPVILIAGPAELPTDASLCIATDVKKAAMISTQHLIEAMGEKGNIVDLLGALSDPNTILRKQGVEEVVAKYPNVHIIDELADIDAWEAATTKIDSLLAARSDEIDGMVATNYIATVVASEALTRLGTKRIKFMGMDDDPKTLKAIKEGYITGTMVQAPYAQAYLGLEALRLLKSGYTIKKGVYFIDSGVTFVNKNNVDTYKEDVKANFLKMLKTFAEDYFNPPKS